MLLKDFIKANYIPRDDIMLLCSVGYQTVSNWLSGHPVPAHHARLIQSHADDIKHNKRHRMFGFNTNLFNGKREEEVITAKTHPHLYEEVNPGQFVKIT